MPDWVLHGLIAPLGILASTQSDYFLPSLLIAFAAGGLVLLGRGERLGALFPRHVYGHPSARIDVAVYLVNKLSFAGAIPVVFATVTAIVLAPLLGAVAAPAWLAESWATRVAYTVAIFLAVDFGVTWGHLLLHRVPVLWEFHKLHHSAPVLMPVTADRSHPVDLAVTGTTTGLCIGLADALFAWAEGGTVDPLAIGGRNAVELLCISFLLHLRHTHLWVSFGPVVGRWLMSPAHHQIHHSADPRHHGRNLGRFLAVWDRLFGTLYVPGRMPEKLSFGLGPAEEAAFASLWNCYVLPFKRAAALVMGTRATQP